MIQTTDIVFFLKKNGYADNYFNYRYHILTVQDIFKFRWAILRRRKI